MALTRSHFAAIALAAAAISSAFALEIARFKRACAAVVRGFLHFVASVPAAFEVPRLALLSRPVELVQACAYAVGLAKRERPHVRSQWRMCPST